MYLPDSTSSFYPLCQGRARRRSSRRRWPRGRRWWPRRSRVSMRSSRMPAMASSSRRGTLRRWRGPSSSWRRTPTPGPVFRGGPEAGHGVHGRQHGREDRKHLRVDRSACPGRLRGADLMGALKINTYYMDQPGDSAWVRVKNRLTRRPIPAFPRTLQIQTFTGCNADCIFCPYGQTYETQPKGKMSPELFKRIIDEAAEHEVRRISPYLMNEPLMDRDLFDKIRYINKTIPGCKVVVTSNGHF